jgi:mannitol/fructose-specific phosphotransferase system IIA component (Ntr-type)
MKICKLLDQENVLCQLEASNKTDVIDKLIGTLGKKIDPKMLENVRKAVFERERIMSTGVGKGLAIPHGKCTGLDRNYASFALLKDPVNFDSIDDQPVSLIFLLVGPESHNSTHIKMLSRISRLMNNSGFRDRLLNAHSSDEIIEAFNQEEAQYFEI